MLTQRSPHQILFTILASFATTGLIACTAPPQKAPPQKSDAVTAPAPASTSTTPVQSSNPPESTLPATPPPAPSAEKPAISSPSLSTEGYGDIRFGTKFSALPANLRTDIKRPIPAEERGCSYVEFKRYPDVAFMVENDIITRADLSKTQPNSLGASFGMTSAEILKRHPNAVVTKHKYDEAGHYLTLSAPDRRSAFVLEESKGRITEIRSGLLPSVKYVEGCA